MFGKRRLQRLVEHFEPVLGTVLELQVIGGNRNVPELARDAILAKIDELESVFSIFRKDSEILKWNDMAPGEFFVEENPLMGIGSNRSYEQLPERVFSGSFVVVLELSLEYWRKSGGAFHPCAGVISDAWKAGEFDERQSEILSQFEKPPYSAGLCEYEKFVNLNLNFNAVAKGYIIDIACLIGRSFSSMGMYLIKRFDDGRSVTSKKISEAKRKLISQGIGAIQPIEGLVVNIGGDLCHWGKGEVIVDVLDPRNNAANADVISRVKVCNAGFATSGRAMRPIQMGGREISHVFDPRTGQPVDHWSGVSVLSTSAWLADILSTTLMVLSLDEGLELVSDMDGTEFLAVDRDGVIFTSPGWPELMR